MRSVSLAALFGGLLIVLLSCGQESLSPELEKWKSDLLLHRAKVDSEMAHAPDSPFAGLKRVSMERDRKHFIVYEDGMFFDSEEKEKGTILEIEFNNGNWRYKTQAEGEIRFQVGKTPLSGNILPMKRITGEFKRYYFVIYPLQDRLVFIIFDPEAKSLKNFTRLYYFPPDTAYRVRARLVKIKNPDLIEMQTSQNRIKKFYRYAEVRFRIKGSSQRLIAYKSSLERSKEQDWLFIPFKDATTGKETYSAGRFLEIKEPSADNFILDFNLAFNPLCNYSHVYNCSYPPEENWLNIPIEAGEKVYPHH